MHCFEGTLLASGSDDLNVVLWDWQRGRPYLVFDSGHRANVFQVLKLDMFCAFLFQVVIN